MMIHHCVCFLRVLPCCGQSYVDVSHLFGPASDPVFSWRSRNDVNICWLCFWILRWDHFAAVPKTVRALSTRWTVSLNINNRIFRRWARETDFSTSGSLNMQWLQREGLKHAIARSDTSCVNEMSHLLLSSLTSYWNWRLVCSEMIVDTHSEI